MLRKKTMIFYVFTILLIFMLFTGCDNNITSSNPSHDSSTEIKSTSGGIEIKGKDISQSEFNHFKELFNMVVDGANIQTVKNFINNQLFLTNSIRYSNTLQFILDNISLVNNGNITLVELIGSSALYIDLYIDDNIGLETFDIVIIEGDFAYYMFAYGEIYILPKK